MQVKQALKCWCRATESDGKIGMKYDALSGRPKLNEKVARVAAQFPSLVHDLESKEGDLDSILNKPNLHRVLELFAHSVTIWTCFKCIQAGF